jgi:hypothetical protein
MAGAQVGGGECGLQQWSGAHEAASSTAAGAVMSAALFDHIGAKNNIMATMIIVPTAAIVVRGLHALVVDSAHAHERLIRRCYQCGTHFYAVGCQRLCDECTYWYPIMANLAAASATPG